MAKISPADTRKALGIWRSLKLSPNLFEKFTGLGYHSYTDDTFLSDESANRVRILLESPHAVTLIKAWEAQNAEE